MAASMVANCRIRKVGLAQIFAASCFLSMAEISLKLLAVVMSKLTWPGRHGPCLLASGFPVGNGGNSWPAVNVRPCIA